jgi:hypothetical protein
MIEFIAPVKIIGEGEGSSGGYYVPTVDADGNLTWLASEEGMPEVEGANIKGPKGETGPKGEPGETGAKGEDGKTPVRGSDYWTAADIAEIKSYVDTAILEGSW